LQAHTSSPMIVIDCDWIGSARKRLGELQT